MRQNYALAELRQQKRVAGFRRERNVGNEIAPTLQRER